jgi:hypothetical protein
VEDDQRGEHRGDVYNNVEGQSAFGLHAEESAADFQVAAAADGEVFRKSLYET